MKKRRPTKTELLARMPAFFRPTLSAAQVRDLALCHHSNFDAITTGEADWDHLWHYVGSVLTWWRVAHSIGAGQREMDTQFDVATRLVARYGRTQRVAFDGPDMQTARDGLIVMDQLAELVDKPTAMAAAAWSETEVNRMAVMAEQEATA